MPEVEGPFDPLAVLRTLVDHGVKFVLIGGLAAAVHGSPFATVDVDVVPRRDPGNLDRLSAALVALDARVYLSATESVPFAHTGKSLADVNVWNLATPHGGLDVTFEPSGTFGYEDLAERAELVDLGGIEVRVAALEDIVRSKAAAGRERDEVVLPALRRLLELEAEERRRDRNQS